MYADDRTTRGEVPSPPSSSSSAPTHENIYTLPNFLTLTRLLSAPAISYLLLSHAYAPALALFLYAGVTDLVDGWLARRMRTQTVLGTILDPLADKVLMTGLVGSLAWGAEGALPVPLAIVILGRDALLSLMALYYRYISLPPPKTFARFWDFSLPSAEVKPTGISKANTALQLLLIGVTMAGLGVGEAVAESNSSTAVKEETGQLEGTRGGNEVVGTTAGRTGDRHDVLARGLGETGMKALEASWWVVGATTVISGLGYLRGRKGLKILPQQQQKGK